MDEEEKALRANAAAGRRAAAVLSIRAGKSVAEVAAAEHVSTRTVEAWVRIEEAARLRQLQDEVARKAVPVRRRWRLPLLGLVVLLASLLVLMLPHATPPAATLPAQTLAAAPVPKLTEGDPDSANFTEFLAAAAAGNLPVLKAYLRAGMDVNRRTGPAQGYAPKTGYTAASYAADAGQAHALSLLLAAGANDDDGDVLASAAGSENPEVVRILLKQKRKYKVGMLAHAANNAAASGRPAQLTLLLDAGVNPNPKIKDGLTLLMLAIGSGDVACVDILLRRGANPNIRTSFGDTPLIRAAYSGNLAVVKRLVAAGASLNAVNGDGDTPYRAAKVMLQDQTVANYLKGREQRGSDVEEDPPPSADETAPDGGGSVTCTVGLRAGLIDKVIVYTVGATTYAINGKARARANQNHWVDGGAVFSADKMQTLLQEGLQQCP